MVITSFFHIRIGLHIDVLQGLDEGDTIKLRQCRRDYCLLIKKEEYENFKNVAIDSIISSIFGL